MNSLRLILATLLFFTMSSYSSAQLHIAQGKTTANDWKTLTAQDINPVTGEKFGGAYVDINTSKCNFDQTPHYIVSIEGTNAGGHWLLSGSSAIYNATPNGFRVHVRWTDYSGFPNADNPITAETAKKYGWFVRWSAISSSDCNCR